MKDNDFGADFENEFDMAIETFSFLNLASAQCKNNRKLCHMFLLAAECVKDEVYKLAGKDRK